VIGPGFRQKGGGKKIDAEDEKEDEDDLGYRGDPPCRSQRGNNVGKTE